MCVIVVFFAVTGSAFGRDPSNLIARNEAGKRLSSLRQDAFGALKDHVRTAASDASVKKEGMAIVGVQGTHLGHDGGIQQVVTASSIGISGESGGSKDNVDDAKQASNDSSKRKGVDDGVSSLEEGAQYREQSGLSNVGAARDNKVRGMHNAGYRNVPLDKKPANHVFHIVTDKLNYAAMRMWFLVNPLDKAAIQKPANHVFHIVTDKLNYAAMRMWFLVNPLDKAAIQVQKIEEFTWLNSSYSPVLKQLESHFMINYYFNTRQNKPDKNPKFRNPKYLSILNHLRFHLPEIFPRLNKVLFVDDDIVVQQDLSPLWSIDLEGKVNGAVQTCGEVFHRFDRYLNFSNPLIAK
ncbi:hypothetical protein ACQ4PT_019420 [Festuca glaucescens]